MMFCFRCLIPSTTFIPLRTMRDWVSILLSLFPAVTHSIDIVLLLHL